MRNTEESEPPRRLKRPQVEQKVNEIEGYAELGMKRDALKLARVYLNRRPLNRHLFCAAMNSLLTTGDRLKIWRPIVEAAHEKLSTRGKRQARFLMLSFYSCLHDDHAADRFIPRRYAGSQWLADLAFALETKLALGRLDEALPIVRRAVKALKRLTDEPGRGLLMHGIAEYLIQVREWEAALYLYNGLQQDEYVAEAAIFGMVVQGVTLHSYRYGWAERAAACGYPERFAQQALGHNSKAVHRAYAKNAGVIVPSLEDWETHWKTSQTMPPAPALTPPSPPPAQPSQIG